MRPDRQAGFTLASAIFLVVVLAALGAIIVTVSGLQHQSAARDLMGVKAYQAARAGIEWGAYRVLRQAALPGAGACPAASTTFAMPVGELSGFSVRVQCTRTTASEGSRSVTATNPLEFYVITARACNQASCPDAVGATGVYIERQLEATIAR